MCRSGKDLSYVRGRLSFPGRGRNIQQSYLRVKGYSDRSNPNAALDRPPEGPFARSNLRKDSQLRMFFVRSVRPGRHGRAYGRGNDALPNDVHQIRTHFRPATLALAGAVADRPSPMPQAAPAEYRETLAATAIRNKGLRRLCEELSRLRENFWQDGTHHRHDQDARA